MRGSRNISLESRRRSFRLATKAEYLILPPHRRLSRNGNFYAEVAMNDPRAVLFLSGEQTEILDGDPYGR